MSKWRTQFGIRLTIISIAGLGVRIAYVLLARRKRLPFGGDSFFDSVGANLFARGRGFVEPLSIQMGHGDPRSVSAPAPRLCRSS